MERTITRPARRWTRATALALALITAACTSSTTRGVAAPPSGGGPSGSAGPIASRSAAPSPTPSPTQRHTPVRVAIFGDSQATALYETRPHSVSKFLTLSDESISACGILGGRVVSRSGESFSLTGACPYWKSHWRDDAMKAKADIALVVVGAWDVFDVKLNNKTLVFGTPEWDSIYLTTMRSGLQAIGESGAQIALAELPCYRPRRRNPRPPGYWPERGDDSRTRHVNNLLRQLADGVHVFTVKPPDAFCDNPSIADNHKYRYDGVHYLQPGAQLYFGAIIPQLLTLPA